MPANSLTEMLGIKYPIIQAGMIWAAGGKLAAACSNAGALGLIGAGSMSPEILRQHILKTKSLTSKPFGINFPLLYNHIEAAIAVALDEGVKIFVTSGGSPKIYTAKLKELGATVIHVVSSPKLAKKCELAGVDAIVAEGFEAGGHNGRAELTTMTLVPQVIDTVAIPVIAAGGIGDGRTMAAALSLGALAVQVGSLFVTAEESSAHINFKNAILAAGAEDTQLSLKNLTPVRLLKNEFFDKIDQLENQKVSNEELLKVLGKNRAKEGMFLGDMTEGKLEIGQISGLFKELSPAETIIQNLIQSYNSTISKLVPITK